jgi:signal transduction histidine kinase
MNSIRQRIITHLLSSVTFLFLIVGCIFWLLGKHLVLREFDLTLQTRLETLASLVELEGYQLDIDYYGGIIREYEQPDSGMYFTFYSPDNQVLVSSPSAGDHHLPLRTGKDSGYPFVKNLSLSDFGDLRIIQHRFTPRRDLQADDPEEINEEEELIPPQEIEILLPPDTDLDSYYFTLVLGRDRTGVLSKIHQITFVLTGTFMLLLTGITVITWFQIRKGFQPLSMLNQQLKGFSPNQSDLRVMLEDTPSELEAVVRTINDYLARAQHTLEREKSFSSNLAHELRTPVAELKTISEMASLFPEDRIHIEQYFNDVKDIAEDMDKLVKQLLKLNRIENRLEKVQLKKINLSKWLNDILKTSSESILFEAPPDILCETDPDLLSLILQNLLANAGSHRVPGSPITCRLDVENQQPVLRLINQVQGISEADLPKMLERFWQLDSARHDRKHFGLGLTLVVNTCELLSIDFTLNLPDPEQFEACIFFPK